jgi:hypothetical protein
VAAEIEALLADVQSAGLGAYRVVPEGHGALADRLAERGIAVRRFPNGAFALIPALGAT